MKKFYSQLAFAALLPALIPALVSAKTTSTGSRLLAHSYYIPNAGSLVGLDSQTYIYPGPSTTLYNQMITYHNSGSGLALYRKADYTYTSGKLTYMEFQNWNAGTSAYTNGGKTFYTINPEGLCAKDSNVLWLTATSAYRDNVLNTYTYNSAGLLTDQVYNYWDAGAGSLLPHYHYANTYNSHNKPLTRLTQDWDASIHWMDYTKTTYEYDATGLLVQRLIGEQAVTTPGILETTYKHIYTLNADGTIASYLMDNWNFSTGSFQPSMRITLTYDAAGNNTLQTEENYDFTISDYKPYQQWIRTYNSHNQKTTETRLSWDGSAYTIPQSKENFYYEDYTVPTGIEELGSADTKLNVYPIPSNGDVHIDLEWAQPQAFTATITDMNGRLAHVFSAGARSRHTEMVNLSAQPAGSYILTVKGEHGDMISRTIVLQH